MEAEIKMAREAFLDLPTAKVRKLVEEKGKPRVGVFVADGNRRLLLARTGLAPDSKEFYSEYARFFVESLEKSLNLFFDHGLQILFFPLFGPSLLKRQNQFHSLTIPAVYNQIFQSPKWMEFYGEKGIRVKVYGDLSAG